MMRVGLRNVHPVRLGPKAVSKHCCCGRRFSSSSSSGASPPPEELSGIRLKVFRRVPIRGEEGEEGQKYNLVRTDLQELLRQCENTQLVVFGEEHGHPLSHIIEFKVLSRMLHASSSGNGPGEAQSVTLSLEMLDTERQAAADAYMAMGGLSKLETLGHPSKAEEELFGGKWHNWFDYAPQCQALRASFPPGVASYHRLLAANAPRRLTRLVAQGGLTALTEALEAAPQDRSLIAPVPWNPPSVRLADKIGPVFETFRGKRDEARKERLILAQRWCRVPAHLFVLLHNLCLFCYSVQVVCLSLCKLSMTPHLFIWKIVFGMPRWLGAFTRSSPSLAAKAAANLARGAACSTFAAGSTRSTGSGSSSTSRRTGRPPQEVTIRRRASEITSNLLFA